MFVVTGGLQSFCFYTPSFAVAGLVQSLVFVVVCGLAYCDCAFIFFGFCLCVRSVAGVLPSLCVFMVLLASYNTVCCVAGLLQRVFVSVAGLLQ